MCLSPPELPRDVYCRHFSLLQACRRHCSCRSAVWRRNWLQRWHRSLCVTVCGQLPQVKCYKNQGTYNRLPIRCPVNINGQHIEIVQSYKYMGTKIDDKLRLDDNSMNVYKKGQQKLYFLRKLNSLHIDRNIWSVFPYSFVKSVMTFGLVCWWGNLCQNQKN